MPFRGLIRNFNSGTSKAIKKFPEAFTSFLCRKSDFCLCYRLLQGLAFWAETTFPRGNKGRKREQKEGTQKFVYCNRGISDRAVN